MKKRGLLVGAVLVLLLSGCARQTDQFDELIEDTVVIKDDGIVLRNVGWFKSEEKVMKAYNADASSYETNEESGTGRLTVNPVLKDLENTGITVEQVMSFAGERLYRMEYFISTNSEAEYLDCLDSLADQLEDLIPNREDKSALDFEALENGTSQVTWTASDESSIAVHPFKVSGDPAYIIIVALDSPVVEEFPSK